MDWERLEYRMVIFFGPAIVVASHAKAVFPILILSSYYDDDSESVKIFPKAAQHHPLTPVALDKQVFSHMSLK